MSFNTSWDKLHKGKSQISSWPWSDLITYVMRYSDVRKPNFRVLELGGGSGANIPFFLSVGAEYWTIEGSATIVEHMHKVYPELINRVVVGDFTETLPFAGPFDLVVDRGSLTHNPSASITRALNLVYPLLADGGKFIGISWFSTECTEFQNGEPTEDRYTRTNFQNGFLTGTGIVHFTDRSHLMDLFKRFQVDVLEHKILKREIPKDDNIVATWNLVARKS